MSLTPFGISSQLCATELSSQAYAIWPISDIGADCFRLLRVDRRAIRRRTLDSIGGHTYPTGVGPHLRFGTALGFHAHGSRRRVQGALRRLHPYHLQADPL